MSVRTVDSSVVSSASREGKNTRVLVVGVGNLLLKDEGIGVHVAGELQKQTLPRTVEVIDAGTAALDILLSQTAPYKLVVIDTTKAGKKPGTIYRVRLKAGEKDKLIRIFGQGSSGISLHQIGLLQALAAAEKTNRLPEEIVLIGVEPNKVDWGLELTEPVKRAIPEIVDTVLKEIEDAVHARQTAG
jgi:hydrogenase maturation protease